MSRYIITAKDPHTHICLVGYDKPLQTYFAQVLERATFDAEELRDMKAEELLYDDENIALWIGTNPFEIGTTNDLQSRLAQHAMIPEAVCMQLEQERAQSPELTTLQREMLALISTWSTAEGYKNGE